MSNQPPNGLEEFISYGLKTCPQEDCRTCLDNVGVLPIFGDVSRPDISLEVMTFGGIQVNKDDDFPQFLCQTCFNLLENAISFRTSAKRTDALLKRRRKRLTQGNMIKMDEGPVDVELEIPKVSTISTTTDPNLIKIHTTYDKNMPVTYEIVHNITSIEKSNPKINFVSVDVTGMIEDNMSYCKQETYTMTNVTNSGIMHINSGSSLLDHDHSDNNDTGSDVLMLIGTSDNEKPNYMKSLDFSKPDFSKPDFSKPDFSKPEYVNSSDSSKSSFDNTKSNFDTDYGASKSTDTTDTKLKSDSFYCKFCKLKFPTSEEYEEHRNTIQHKRNYVISFLPKKKSPNDKESTPRKSSKPKDQQCNICNELFTNIQYTRHMLNVHDIKVPPANTKRECKICKKMIDRRSMPRHVKRKHECDDKDNLEPKVKLECPICKKVFAKQYFPLHMNRHKEIENKKYVCDQCGRKFAFKSSFNTHRLVHTNEYPHKCDYCPYQGRTKGLLKIHMRTHTGDYPFKCTQCDTRCLTKSNLNWHMRRHRGPIDFVCGACNRGFYSKLQLERHISVTHYGQKNHICTFCGSAFGYRNGLMRHLRKVHKRPKVRGVGKSKTYLLPPQEQDIMQNKPPEPPQLPPPQAPPTYMVQNFVY